MSRSMPKDSSKPCPNRCTRGFILGKPCPWCKGTGTDDTDRYATVPTEEAEKHNLEPKEAKEEKIKRIVHDIREAAEEAKPAETKWSVVKAIEHLISQKMHRAYEYGWEDAMLQYNPPDKGELSE